MKLNKLLEAYYLPKLSDREEARLIKMLKKQARISPEDFNKSLDHLNMVRKSEGFEPLTKEQLFIKKPHDISSAINYDLKNEPAGGTTLKKGTWVDLKSRKGPHTIIKKRGENYIVRSPHGGTLIVSKEEIKNPRVLGKDNESAKKDLNLTQTAAAFEDYLKNKYVLKKYNRAKDPEIGDIVTTKSLNGRWKIVSITTKKEYWKGQFKSSLGNPDDWMYKIMPLKHLTNKVETGASPNYIDDTEIEKLEKQPQKEGPAPFGGKSEHYYSDKEAKEKRKEAKEKRGLSWI